MHLRGKDTGLPTAFDTRQRMADTAHASTKLPQGWSQSNGAQPQVVQDQATIGLSPLLGRAPVVVVDGVEHVVLHVPAEGGEGHAHVHPRNSHACKSLNVYQQEGPEERTVQVQRAGDQRKATSDSFSSACRARKGSRATAHSCHTHPRCCHPARAAGWNSGRSGAASPTGSRGAANRRCRGCKLRWIGRVWM